MLFQVNGFQIKPLLKASDDGLVMVDIVANPLIEDTESETILKAAFDKETVQEFLDNGVIEYWHETRNPILTKEEKNKYLIGKPVGFRWENGLPVVTAQLTRKKDIVQDMLPHLEAKQPVYSASVGGSKVVLKVKDAQNREHGIIPKIKWDHLAIAPAPYVVAKNPSMTVRLLHKANDLMCEFDDINIFARNTNIGDREEELRKALMAPGSVGDMYNGSAGGAVTKQSLEKKISNLTLDEDEGLDFIDTIIGIKNKKIPLTKADFLKHFKDQKKESFGQKSYGLIDKYFKSKKGSE